MNIMPSMDLYAGKITRLKQGDFNQSKTYDLDPLDTLKRFQDAGAHMVHIVDLEATHTGKKAHFEFIQKAASHLEIPLQVGGGIRDLKTAQAYLNAGITRIVIGSLALKDYTAVDTLNQMYPGRIVIALDVKESNVMTHGWLSASGQTITEVIEQFESLNHLRFLITDIATDGMLKGPNVELYQRIKSMSDVPLIASGGITTCEDIKALAGLNVEEAVIGKAMYEGTLPIEEALKC